MNLIILAAGEGKQSFNSSENLPVCLHSIENSTVLDKLITITNIQNISLVGGFKILEIMQRYPNLKYFYNEKWKKTKSLFSFFKAFSILNKNTLISYADILHKNDVVNLIDQEMINIFYDSKWETRYENRDTKNLEKIYKNHKLLGEFTGLLYIPTHKIEYIIEITKKILKNKIDSTLLDLINELEISIEINYIDLSGNWAELDSLQDIEHFKFGTKADTLNKLKKELKKSHILTQYTFTVKEYESNQNNIINKIQKKLDSNLLVVRSSALNEDTENSSMAGNYESILKVEKDNNIILMNAIEDVIESYKKNNQKQDNNNQILVQPYLENVTMSGVVFSKNLQTASPYYTINYDESADTESVTSGNGQGLNTFICYNDFEYKIEDKNLSILINAIKEIEKVTKFDAIDVEFAFVNDMLYILQVRPIAAKKDSITVSNKEISDEINKIKLFLDNKSIHLLGNKKAYGVMPDWNPAEIIGINPKPLSFDLYKYIITNNIWSKSRKDLGYRNVENHVGLVSFSGKPYVDIQMSFNTFIPNNLDKKIGTKLIDYFIEKLEKYPQHHDKVEFEIAITAYDFLFENKIIELKKNRFTNEECKLIKKSYKILTENIILEKNHSIDDEINKTILLTEKRENILNKNMDNIDKLFLLLEDCKEYGTLPFSNLARFGFIGSIFLKSLLSKNLIEETEYNNFFKSIHTVAKEFMNDFNMLVSNQLSRDKFINKYGHLRPGTYDISSLSYQDGLDNYIDMDSKISKIEDSHYKFSEEIYKKITEEIKIHDLNFSADQLVRFIIKATEAREKAKFEFTKSLSSILELIVEIGKSIDLTREDLSYLNLDKLLKYRNSTSRLNFKNSLKENIDINKKNFLITSSILLPELIFSKKDIEMFFYPSLKPNFISHHKIDAEIIFLNNSKKVSIENKIILIENADPGFDWIFSHNIKGLVTKYGGAASHMAIRCAEFDLPAAIGCGDKIFNELVNSKKISLDCINNKIKSIL